MNMRLIKTKEISGAIMTLIEEAEKELFIVSPYNKITNWRKLINTIEKAKSKGINISWYSRKNNVDNKNAEEVISNLNINPILVDNLHAKIYLNESCAIITSMNMHSSSDDNSIEIGYETQTKGEYEEVLDFFNKYIKNYVQQSDKSDHINEILPFNISQNPSPARLSKDEQFINTIHDHITNIYGLQKHNYLRGEMLEYISFMRRDYKIQFIPYSAAIRVQVWMPAGYSFEFINRTLANSKNRKKLTYKDELEVIEEPPGCYVKYYYRHYGHPNMWHRDTLNEFLKDLDIMIKIVFEKV